MRSAEELPKELFMYLSAIEGYMLQKKSPIKIVGVGVGPEREQFIKMP